MKIFSNTICAAIALTFAAGSALPVAAAPLVAPNAQTEAAGGNVLDVQMSGEQRQRRFDRRQDRREDRFEHRQDRREARFERRNGRYYYNGHRGYRERRDGYRYYNGYWFPAGAFIAGAIISGAINNATQSSGSAHVNWCHDRYRTYRSSDNTYMSSAGYRKACNSPYS
ncbi:BA14K family protein [Mesorhizobium australicum]|uniref:Lectin-like protein BA14k n=1 Tax=Mesorhizobium australicum TaxID=536018 RepID=A0A1X7PJT5_9HYPH|nr:BA14K family protein [Mesorhizobium australicum]SMH51353.1 BA14K-like protein [Mesorhizobium australicum]